MNSSSESPYRPDPGPATPVDIAAIPVNLSDFLPATDNKWEFVGVYTTEGISGTSANRREGFKQMIADALPRKIDPIITKIYTRTI